MMSASAWTRFAATGLAVAATVVSAGPSLAATAEPAGARSSVTGSAQLRYTPGPADDVRVAVDARVVAVDSGAQPTSTKADGTVRISHWFAAEKQAVWFEGRVECGITTGRMAVLSAVITDTSPNVAQFRGRHVGITVMDGGSDRPRRSWDQVGWTGPTTDPLVCTPMGPQPLPLMSPAPSLLLSSGGFRVGSARH